ncbi:DUF4332 domain-containing protein [Candidatus Latescibacterota bacterium]
MGYYTDLKKISIDKYKKILKSTDLIPSRKILINNIDDIFNIIKKQKIENVDELYRALKNKNNLQDFSEKSGIQEDYLKILMREVNSYRPSPSKIKDFPGISEHVIFKLENAGIKSTLQLFDKILTQQRRSEISNQTEISENEILKLAKLTDLTRIRWVNHTFAYVLYEAGYDTAKKVAGADYTALYEKVKTLNEERKFYKGTIGLRDMNRCVEAAKEVSLEIDY